MLISRLDILFSCVLICHQSLGLIKIIYRFSLIGCAFFIGLSFCGVFLHGVCMCVWLCICLILTYLLFFSLPLSLFSCVSIAITRKFLHEKSIDRARYMNVCLSIVLGWHLIFARWIFFDCFILSLNGKNCKIENLVQSDIQEWVQARDRKKANKQKQKKKSKWFVVAKWMWAVNMKLPFDCRTFL